MRYLGLLRLDENQVAAKGGPGPELIDRITRLIEEMKRAGVLLDTAGLAPSAEGTRLRLKSGRVTATDGPFTEAREVVGGYILLQVASREEAVEWVRRFLDLHGEEWELESELREVVGGPDLD